MAVCFLLPELGLLPASVFHKLGASLPLFPRGPLEVPGAVDHVTPAWHPSPQTHSHSPLPHGQYCTELEMCLQGSERAGYPDLGNEALEQAWRSNL